jgi:hypothetical protein
VDLTLAPTGRASVCKGRGVPVARLFSKEAFVPKTPCRSISGAGRVSASLYWPTFTQVLRRDLLMLVETSMLAGRRCPAAITQQIARSRLATMGSRIRSLRMPTGSIRARCQSPGDSQTRRINLPFSIPAVTADGESMGRSCRRIPSRFGLSVDQISAGSMRSSRC